MGVRPNLTANYGAGTVSVSENGFQISHQPESSFTILHAIANLQISPKLPSYHFWEASQKHTLAPSSPVGSDAQSEMQGGEPGSSKRVMKSK